MKKILLFVIAIAFFAACKNADNTSKIENKNSKKEVQSVNITKTEEIKYNASSNIELSQNDSSTYTTIEE